MCTCISQPRYVFPLNHCGIRSPNGIDGHPYRWQWLALSWLLITLNCWPVAPLLHCYWQEVSPGLTQDTPLAMIPVALLHVMWLWCICLLRVFIVFIQEHNQFYWLLCSPDLSWPHCCSIFRIPFNNTNITHWWQRWDCFMFVEVAFSTEGGLSTAQIYACGG